MFMNDASCPSQRQSPSFLSRAMRNDHSHTLSPVHPKSGFRQYPVIRSRVSVTLPRKRRAARATCDERPRETAARDIHVVEYVRDSNYGLCPAVMATTVRRFPLGMTIDDRGGCASDFFLVSFFFNSLFPPLSPPVRWERKPDRGSLRPLWSFCNHSDVVSATRRWKRDVRETRGMDGEDRREPFEFANPVRTYARNETWRPVRSLPLSLRRSQGHGKTGLTGHWSRTELETSFDKSRRVESVTTRLVRGDTPRADSSELTSAAERKGWKRKIARQLHPRFCSSRLSDDGYRLHQF